MAAGSAGRSRISHGRFTVYALSDVFFSSRRRHTRSLCDWSSDVCSSDLQWMVQPGHNKGTLSMPTLVISIDGAVIKEVQLAKERTTLGRRPYNDIVIDNLAVSGEHAVLRDRKSVV